MKYSYITIFTVDKYGRKLFPIKKGDNTFEITSDSDLDTRLQHQLNCDYLLSKSYHMDRAAFFYHLVLDSDTSYKADNVELFKRDDLTVEMLYSKDSRFIENSMLSEMSTLCRSIAGTFDSSSKDF